MVSCSGLDIVLAPSSSRRYIASPSGISPRSHLYLSILRTLSCKVSTTNLSYDRFPTLGTLFSCINLQRRSIFSSCIPL